MSVFGKNLILGAGGMLGSHLALILQHRGLDVHSPTGHHFSTATSIREFLNVIQPNVVVNCIGYTGHDATLHFWVNGCFPRVIADWCGEKRILCVHVSTNAVFAPSETRVWLPLDAHDPTTPYEVAKSFGEDPRVYIIRSTFIGVRPRGTSIYDRLLSGQSYTNRLWNGVTVLELCNRICELITLIGPHSHPCVEHLHSPAISSFSTLAQLISSRSQVDGYASDARLLGGGPCLASIAQQLYEYRAWYTRVRW